MEELIWHINDLVQAGDKLVWDFEKRGLTSGYKSLMKLRIKLALEAVERIRKEDKDNAGI